MGGRLPACRLRCGEGETERAASSRLPSLRRAPQQAFNWDVIHPDGLTGTRVMAELAIHAIQSALKSVKEEPLTQHEADAAEGPLPAPLIPHNYQSLTDTCFIGSHFTSIVTYQDRCGRLRLSLALGCVWRLPVLLFSRVALRTLHANQTCTRRFQWVNEAKNGSIRPKWGMVANEVRVQPWHHGT